MSVGQFRGGVAGLVWCPASQRYLLLKRSSAKDFAPGVWECVTGRVDQGEGFEDALRREVREELGVEVRIDFLLGTTHFYRGEEKPENELIGVVCLCSLAGPADVCIGAEHSEYRGVTAQEAVDLLVDADPSTRWIRRVIERAEAVRQLSPPALLGYYRQKGAELG